MSAEPSNQPQNPPQQASSSSGSAAQMIADPFEKAAKYFIISGKDIPKTVLQNPNVGKIAPGEKMYLGETNSRPFATICKVIYGWDVETKPYTEKKVLQKYDEYYEEALVTRNWDFYPCLLDGFRDRRFWCTGRLLESYNAKEKTLDPEVIAFIHAFWADIKDRAKIRAEALEVGYVMNSNTRNKRGPPE